MAKKGFGGAGLLLGAVALGLGYTMLRQGQATTNALTTARLKSFQITGWNGTTLAATAGVEFNNTSVGRDVQLQALGLNLAYNDTTLGTAHLVTAPVLAANQNTLVQVPVTLNVGTLLTQLALTGKVPNLKTFTSVGAIVGWLRDKIAPEALRMTGQAKVNGLAIDIDQEVPLANYLPSAPRQAGEQPLPGRPVTARPAASSSGTATVPATVRPTRVQQVTTTARQAAGKARQAGAFVRDTASDVTAAVRQTRAAGGQRRPRPTSQGKATASKGRKPGKPPKPAGNGLPHVNLPTTKRGGNYEV